jgi:hypothetical protein
MPCCCCGLDGKIRVTPVEAMLCSLLDWIGRRGELQLAYDYVAKHEGKNLKGWYVEHLKTDRHNNKDHFTDPYGCPYPEHNKPIEESRVEEI